MNNVKYKSVLILLVYICSISYIYIPVFHTYFLHDEWRQIAGILEYGPIRALPAFSVPEILLGKGRIIGTFINNMFYYLFPFQTVPFLIFAFVGHIINSFLFYRIVLRFTRNWKVAFFSGLFFAVSGRHQEAISWIGAGVQIVGSLFFTLLSCEAFLYFLDKRKTWYLFISFLLWYISYLFREQAIFLIPVIGMVLLKQLWRNRNIHGLITYASALIFLGAGLFTANSLFLSNIGNTFGSSGLLLFQKQILNSIFYPYISLGQYFIPYRFIYRSAEWVMNTWYPFMNTGGNNETLIHFPLSDIVSGFASLVIILGIVWMYVSYKKGRWLIIFTIILYVASFLPTAFHLIHRYDSLIQSRFMYITTPFVAFLFGNFVWFLSGYIFKKRQWLGVIIILASLLFLEKEMTVARREVNVLVISGKEMTGFLSSYKKVMPSMPPNSILLIEGDRNYYYEHNTMPFQLGGGYILSVIYYKDGTIPLTAIKRTPAAEEPFVSFGSQGVVSDGKKTFGYYWDRNMLRKDLKEKKFSINQVRAFRYTSGNSQIANITEEIRTFLAL